MRSEPQGKEWPQWRYRFHLPAYPTQTAATVPHQQAGTQKGQDQQASTEQAEHQHYSEQPPPVKHQAPRPERQGVSVTSAAEHPQPAPTAAPQQEQELRLPT